MLLTLLLQATVGPPLPGDVWASLTVSASLAHRSESVEFLRTGGEALDGDVLLRRTTRHLEDAPKVMWATSRTCAGVRQAVARFDQIPLPAVVKPGDPESLVLDGVGYAVRFYGRYGDEIGTPMQLSSNSGTTLSRWIDSTLSILKPCWSENRP